MVGVFQHMWFEKSKAFFAGLLFEDFLHLSAFLPRRKKKRALHKNGLVTRFNSQWHRTHTKALKELIKQRKLNETMASSSSGWHGDGDNSNELSHENVLRTIGEHRFDEDDDVCQEEMNNVVPSSSTARRQKRLLKKVRMHRIKWEKMSLLIVRSDGKKRFNEYFFFGGNISFLLLFINCFFLFLFLSTSQAPDAPKRFKSAYICFVMERMDGVKEELDKDVKVTDLMRALATRWRELPIDERQKFEAMAETDKTRYFEEMSSYKGPMHVPNKRIKKSADAPKRAMSAFLSFSQAMRPGIRAEYPNMKNTDISGILAEKWREAPDEVKRPHIDR